MNRRRRLPDFKNDLILSQHQDLWKFDLMDIAFSGTPEMELLKMSQLKKTIFALICGDVWLPRFVPYTALKVRAAITHLWQVCPTWATLDETLVSIALNKYVASKSGRLLWHGSRRCYYCSNRAIGYPTKRQFECATTRLPRLGGSLIPYRYGILRRHQDLPLQDLRQQNLWLQDLPIDSSKPSRTYKWWEAERGISGSKNSGQRKNFPSWRLFDYTAASTFLQPLNGWRWPTSWSTHPLTRTWFGRTRWPWIIIMLLTLYLLHGQPSPISWKR